MDCAQNDRAASKLRGIIGSALDFLERIRNSDTRAEEIYAKLEFLAATLEGVISLIRRARNHADPYRLGDITNARARVVHSVEACKASFNALEGQLQGGFSFDPEQPNHALLLRFRAAWNSSSIEKTLQDLNARIGILQTNLIVLQLHSQSETHAAVDLNYAEQNNILLDLSRIVEQNRQLLTLILRRQTAPLQNSETDAYDPEPRLARHYGPSISISPSADNTAEALSECIREANDVHNRYSSGYFPDDQSIRARSRDFGETRAAPFQVIATPLSGPEITPPPSRPHSAVRREPSLPPDEKEVYDLDILEEVIREHKDSFYRQKKTGHYQQAESELRDAIHESKVRAKVYKIPFVDKILLDEELAVLLQKQKKYGDAIREVQRLLSESELVPGIDASERRARQNQLLASIYYDKFVSGDAAATTVASAGDIERAENHAKRALRLRTEYIQTGLTPAQDDAVRRAQNECITQLVKILSAQDKTAEVAVMRRRLSSIDNASSSVESIRATLTRESRTSFSTCPIVEDAMEAIPETLLAAIKSRQHSQVQLYLRNHEVLDIQGRCLEGKTYLTHAVESANVKTVNSLLSPSIGVDVNGVNQDGSTALHVAAEAGHLQIVHALIGADANVNSIDRRGQIPILRAVINGHAEVVRFLAERGADLLFRSAERQETLLHYAVGQKKAPLCQQIAVTGILLEKDEALKDRADFRGQTPLCQCAQHSAERSRIEHARVLLAYGANVNLADNAHRTPLHFATDHVKDAARNDFVELLVEKQANFGQRRAPSQHAMEYPVLQDLLAPRRRTTMTNKVPRQDSMDSAGTGDTKSTKKGKMSRLFTRSPKV